MPWHIPISGRDRSRKIEENKISFRHSESTIVGDESLSIKDGFPSTRILINRLTESPIPQRMEVGSKKQEDK